jgi:hypothetical protein
MQTEMNKALCAGMRWGRKSIERKEDGLQNGDLYSIDILAFPRYSDRVEASPNQRGVKALHCTSLYSTAKPNDLKKGHP